MDLERNAIGISKYLKTERPIHPDFAAFLRQKKAELEQPH